MSVEEPPKKRVRISKNEPINETVVKSLEQTLSSSGNDLEAILLCFTDLIAILTGNEEIVNQNTATILKNIPLPLLFNCLNLWDTEKFFELQKDEIELREEIVKRDARVLNKLLDFLPSSALKDENILKGIIIGSKHGHESVRRLAITQAARFLTEDNLVDFLFDQKNAALSQIIVDAFADEEISIAKEGHNALCKTLPNSPKITEFFFNPIHDKQFDFMKQLSVAAKLNDTVKMRTFDLFCSLAVLSPKAEEFCEKLGVFDQIINTVLNSKNDAIVFLNILETIRILFQSPKALQYLHKQLFFEKLLDFLITRKEDDVITSFLLQFICQVLKEANLMEKMETEKLQNLFKTILSFLDEEKANVHTQETGLSILGSYCANSPNAFDLFLSNKKAMELYCSYFLKPAVSLQIAFLNSFAMITASKEVPTKKLEQLFDHLNQHHTNGKSVAYFLVKMIETPFEEIVAPACNCAKSLVGHTWGLEHLLSYPVFIDTIVHRDKSYAKKIKESRWELVVEIVEGIKREQMNNEKLYVEEKKKLTEFMSKGPYYTEVTHYAGVAKEAAGT